MSAESHDQDVDRVLAEAEALVSGKPLVYFVPEIADPTAPTRAEMARAVFIGTADLQPEDGEHP